MSDGRMATRADAPRFDTTFRYDLDADKVNTANYFDWALRLTRPGSVIIVDNVVRKGAILDTTSDDGECEQSPSIWRR